MPGAKPVEDQRYLDQLLEYIHLNPVAAGLAEDPETEARIDALDRGLCEKSGPKD